MDFLGLETPAGVQGKSLTALAKGKTDRHRDVVYSEFPNESGKQRRESGGGYDPTVMRFDGRYKLVDNGLEIPPELYDTKEDPRETVNLRKRPEQQARLKQMLAETRAWVKQDAVPINHPKKGQDPDA
jgi:arylsulfatase A-like enzyme